MSREPTHADFQVLQGVVEAVKQSEPAVAFVNAVHDKLDAGGTLSAAELEEYQAAMAIVHRARWAIDAWQSWWPPENA